jgi:hypothetical protein
MGLARCVHCILCQEYNKKSRKQSYLAEDVCPGPEGKVREDEGIAFSLHLVVLFIYGSFLVLDFPNLWILYRFGKMVPVSGTYFSA